MAEITVPESARIFKRGQDTEIAIWASEYKGTKQVSVAQRHPKRTGGYWKSGVGNFDAELSVAFAEVAMGHTLGDVQAPAAPKTPARRGRTAAKK